jgi:FkbM family methyltransferase
MAILEIVNFNNKGMSKFFNSTAKLFRPLINKINDRLAESKFESKVSEILAGSSFNQKENIITFSYQQKEYRFQIPDIRDYISFNMAYKKTFYDVHDLEAISEFIAPGGVIIDAGANIGSHSVFFASQLQASRVFSFEPQKNIFKLLEKNISLNNLEQIITPFQCGLGEKSTTASQLYRDDVKISTTSNQVNYGGLYLKEDATGEFTIETLDSLLFDKIDKLDFIKIDVQGFEAGVLKGGSKTITKFKPLIFLECMTKTELNNSILPIMDSLDYKIKKVFEIDYLFESSL